MNSRRRCHGENSCARYDASADDAERKQRKGKRPRKRPQGLGGLLCGFDMRLAVRVQRRRCGDDDEEANDVREQHARTRINFDSRRLLLTQAARLWRCWLRRFAGA